MKFNFFILLTILISLGVSTSFNASANTEQRRKQILSIIDDELREVRRLNKQTGSKNPTMLLRMAELYLEKARLVKEEENLKFLTLSPEERKKANRKKYFKNSNKYFVAAQKTCIYILKRFKNFNRKGDVYYILAYNAQEFQRPDQAKKFFNKAASVAGRNSKTVKKSKLALAEFHYNNKNYSKALPYYEQALSGSRTTWYTKDSYNQAWCYFRVGRKDQAIQKMKEVYDLSKNPKYVNMSSQVERDLAYFYADAGRIAEAIRFYREIGKDVSSNLIKVGKVLKNQGRFTSAQKTFTEALKYVSADSDKVAVHVELLSLYEKFGKTKLHFASTRELADFHKRGLLNSDQLEILKYHVKTMSALLQKQVASKRYESRKRVREAKAKYAVAYFKILSEIEKGDGYNSLFFAAETYYSSGKYDNSVEMYDGAYTGAKRAGDQKIAILSLEGMLSALGKKGVSKATSEKYLIPGYERYLSEVPREKKSDRIFQRLFQSYMSKNDIANAERTLIRYKENFPNAVKTQEAMLARVMDYYKNKNDRDGIVKWVKSINNGDFVVSKKYADKVRVLLLTMKFESVEKASSKGEKKQALRGYVEIYKSAESSRDEKKNAAYNIAVLFYELSDATRTYGWSKRALENMTTADVKRFESTFVLLAAGLFSQRKFNEAAEINSMAFEKLCSERTGTKDKFFKNSVVLYLAENKVDQAILMIGKAKKCQVSKKYTDEASLDVLKSLAESERWSTYEEFLRETSERKSLYSQLIYPTSLLRTEYYKRGRNSDGKELGKKILDYYSYARKEKQSIPLEGLDVVAIIRLNDLDSKIAQLKNLKLTFPETAYNQSLQQKFKALDSITTKAVDTLAVRSGKGITKAYQMLIDSYNYVADEIEAFTPPGKSPEYISSFKNEMKRLTSPLRSKVEEFNKEAVSAIQKGTILSKDNYLFFTSKKIPIKLRYFPSHNGVLMDRGGKK